MVRLFKLITASVLISASLSAPAHAGFLLQPSVLYHMGTYDFTAKSTSLLSTDKGKMDGFSAGIIAAYQVSMFFVGGYFDMGSLTSKSDSGGTSFGTGQSTVGAVVGLSLPIGLKAYLGYGVADAVVIRTSNGDLTYTGGSYKLGLSYRLLPFLHLNGEYRVYNMDKVKLSPFVDSTTSAEYSKKDMSAMCFGIAVPFSF